MILTGTLVNYYTHCQRQCWLFYHRINMEDNSEDVRVGRVLHELKNSGEAEVAIDGIKLDKISLVYVTEIKKSDADLPAALAQLEYYLIVLYDKGIIRKGRLECWEKKKQDKKIHTLTLNEEIISERKKYYQEIEDLLYSGVPPLPVLRSGCKKCAYFEYCFL